MMMYVGSREKNQDEERILTQASASETVSSRETEMKEEESIWMGSGMRRCERRL